MSGKGAASATLPSARVRSGIEPRTPETASRLGDGAIVDRLVRMRIACQALATELARTKRELRAVKSELRRLEQRDQRGSAEGASP
jgi:hypothetical protein